MNTDDIISKFPVAEPWSLAVGPIGRGLIFAGLILFVLCGVTAVLAGIRPPGSRSTLRKTSTVAFVLGAVTLFGAIVCLGTLFANNQFQYRYVTAHGDVHTALQYKIAGIWSGQQGSFLLWATTSAIFGLLTLRGTGPYRPIYLAVYSGFLAVLCGILSYETPFGLIDEVVRNGKVFVPPTGNGLEPSLLNYWVVIHPPTIFMGFGSLTALFAYSVSAIISGDLTEWVARVRPWAMVSTAILGVGICMGGFWAYETLGWGGFWGWDPVENASFVPWLFVVTFVHGLIVQTTRKHWHGTNLWLGVLPFITFCYGTLLTRGGYLDGTSVHSFASMDKSALSILKIFILLLVIGFTALYRWRGRPLAKAADVPKPPEAGISRESLYGAGVLLISLLGAVLAIGMSWPVIMALTGRSAAKVEEGLYHLVVVWFFVPIMVLIAVTPFVGWKVLGFRELVRRVANVFSAAVAITGVTLLLLRIPDWGVRATSGATVAMPFHARMSAAPWIAALFLVCAFALVANLWRVVETMKRSPTGVGGFIAHIGIATLFAGLILSRGFEQKEQIFVHGGQATPALGFTLAYTGLGGAGPEDPSGTAKFTVTEPSGDTFTATPGLYYRPQSENPDEPMVWPYIRHYAAHDFYLTLGKPIFTVWPKPLHIKPGETLTDTGVTVTYRKMTMEGQPGTNSARFGADLHIAIDGGQYDVTPKIAVADGPDMPQISPEYRVSMMGLDPSDRSANIQIYFSSPIFPIELFTKPLTGFVWAGAGIMALGSLLAAWSRRRKKKVVEA